MSPAAQGVAGVASGHPLATDAGIDALANGGSAADAALAAAFTQWVVNAPLCGPGGDCVALVTAGDQVIVYGGWSRVPLGIDPTAMPEPSGPRGAVVPGSLRGVEALWQAHGRLPWRDLFGAALRAAGGHMITARMEKVFELVTAKGHSDATRRVTNAGASPLSGDVIALPALGETIGRIAEEGADAFYFGSIAAAIDAAARRDGGWLRAEDLASITAEVTTAVRFDLDDVSVWVPDWPSQAKITPALLAQVDASVDPACREFAEAVGPLTEELLVKRCAQGLAGTAVSSAVDDTGLSVALVHSLAGTQFGTGWVAGDTGVAFGNRVGSALSVRADLPAANPVGGAVLPHTLSAAHVRAPGRWMTVATPGGDRQVQWLTQAIQRFRLNAGTESIAADPRWFVCPEGDRFGVPSGIGQEWFMFGEEGIQWRDDAEVAGYQVKHMSTGGGGLQVIVGGDDDAVELASDPRAGGATRALPQKETDHVHRPEVH